VRREPKCKSAADVSRGGVNRKADCMKSSGLREQKKLPSTGKRAKAGNSGHSAEKRMVKENCSAT